MRAPPAHGFVQALRALHHTGWSHSGAQGKLLRRLPPRFAVSQANRTRTQPQRLNVAANFINKQEKKQLASRAREPKSRLGKNRSLRTIRQQKPAPCL